MAASVCLMLGIGFCVLSQASAAGMTDSYRKSIVDDHNDLRRTLGAGNMRKMEYDTKLECVARKFLERTTGKFKEHNANAKKDYAACGGDGGVGENWYSGKPDTATWAWVDAKWPWKDPNGCSERENWAAEKKDRASVSSDKAYSRALADCGKGGPVAHYSQVLWAESTHIGCWYTKDFGTVCNYSPPGNVYRNGKLKDYVKYGPSCSLCPAAANKCVRNLCDSKGGSDPEPTSEPEKTKTTETKSQTTEIEPAATKTKTQESVIEVAATKTKTQESVIEVAATKTKTQETVIEIAATKTKTQESVIEVAATKTKTQVSMIDIAATKTKTQATVIEPAATKKTQVAEIVPDVTENDQVDDVVDEIDQVDAVDSSNLDVIDSGSNDYGYDEMYYGSDDDFDYSDDDK